MPTKTCAFNILNINLKPYTLKNKFIHTTNIRRHLLPREVNYLLSLIELTPNLIFFLLIYTKLTIFFTFEMFKNYSK